MKKTVLITGGAGFIGRSLTRALLANGHRVRILDNFSAQVHEIDSLPADLNGQVELIRADICDRVALRQALLGVDSVVHLAAETGTGQSMYEIERYFKVNVQGTAILLDLLQNDSCGESIKSIVVASSRAIYGEGAYQCNVHGLIYPNQRTRTDMSKGLFEPVCPVCSNSTKIMSTPETAPFMPMSVYGLTKQVQEQAVLMFARTKAINGFALRYQNVYGAGQSLKNPYTGILAVFSNLARQNQPIEIYEDGDESRDFVHIDDVVDATQRCVNYSGHFVGALNIGTGVATTVLEVAEEVKKFFNSTSAVTVSGAFRVGDIRHNIADTTFTENLLGYTAQVAFKDGLASFLTWASEQSVQDKKAYSRSVQELMSKGLMGKSAN